MINVDWKLVPDGETTRGFQATLMDANFALDQNRRGVHVTTVPAEVVLSFLDGVSEKLKRQSGMYLLQRINLILIATTMYEAPQNYVKSSNRKAFDYGELWLQAKLDTLRCALHQEQPRAQTAAINFISSWHMVVSDNYLK